jgi:hypothetical protein
LIKQGMCFWRNAHTHLKKRVDGERERNKTCFCSMDRLYTYTKLNTALKVK